MCRFVYECFQLLWVNTEECVAESYDQNIFSFVSTTKLSSKVAVQVCISPAMNKNSCCSIVSPAFGVVSVLGVNYTNRCAVASNCCFNLQFFADIRCGAPFICLFAIKISSLVKCLLRSLAHF